MIDYILGYLLFGAIWAATCSFAYERRRVKDGEHRTTRYYIGMSLFHTFFWIVTFPMTIYLTFKYIKNN